MILRWNHFSDFRKTEFSDIYAIYIKVPVREGGGVALVKKNLDIYAIYI